MRRVDFGSGLSGDLHEAGPACVVLAHGLTGDRAMGGRFDRLCAALCQAGISALAFDMPARVTIDGHVAALREAIAFTGARALYGQSWGSLVCASAAPELPMVLAAAAIAPIAYRWEDFFSAAQLDELRVTGHMRIGRAVVPQETFDLFARIKIPRLRRPALIIHGDQGWEERTALAGTRAARKRLTPLTELHVLEGADHSLRARWDDVVALAVPWLSRQLGLQR